MLACPAGLGSGGSGCAGVSGRSEGSACEGSACISGVSGANFKGHARGCEAFARMTPLRSGPGILLRSNCLLDFGVHGGLLGGTAVGGVNGAHVRCIL